MTPSGHVPNRALPKKKGKYVISGTLFKYNFESKKRQVTLALPYFIDIFASQEIIREKKHVVLVQGDESWSTLIGLAAR